MRDKAVMFLHAHRGITFLLMGACFILFGLASVDLLFLLKKNLDLFIDYGTMVIGDGALQQLFELLVTGYFGLLFYVLFKCCEHILVDSLTHRHHEPNTAAPMEEGLPEDAGQP